MIYSGVKDFRDKGYERLLVLEIRQSPAGMDLGFGRSFYGVCLHPLIGRGALFGVEWPHANERLIQEDFFVAVRHGLPLKHFSVASIQLGPAMQMSLPVFGNFRENIDACPDIFGSFCIVGCADI